MKRWRFIGLILCMFCLALAATACEEATPLPVAEAKLPAKSPDWLKVYFTVPNPPDSPSSEIEQTVIAAIEQAQKTIDVASFDFNLPDVTTALVNAQQRGVVVRMVLDQENGSQELKASEGNGNQTFAALKVLKKAKIKIINGGRSNGLMHDKFIIIDGSVLFVGSWNISYNDTFRNDNNLLEIHNAQLIENYQAKFDDLFVKKHFGAHSETGAFQPELTIDGMQVENYFSPTDEVMSRLVKIVGQAKHSIRFMAFTYTHPDLSEAMIERFKAGVTVEGVIENRGASRGALVPLFCADVPVKTDGNKYTMHHKVIIIDDETVVTGSFNFTASADEANDDNVIILHDANIAALYLNEFERVYEMGNTPSADDISCE